MFLVSITYYNQKYTLYTCLFMKYETNGYKVDSRYNEKYDFLDITKFSWPKLSRNNAFSGACYNEFLIAIMMRYTSISV